MGTIKSVCLCVCVFYIIFLRERKNKMKRRDPTRIELKLDDIQEYEQMKRDLEKKGKQADDANTVMQQESTTGGGTEATIAEGAISRTETIHRRIGYDPAPKMS